MLKIGLIIEHRAIAAWQAACLKALADNAEFIVYDCTNGRPSPRSARHACYYLLNLAALRTRLTARVPLPPGLKIVAEVPFEAEHDGNWQRLPAPLLERIKQDRPNFILKFGMGLLRVPPREALAAPVLSYHHGDPREFRGRPAGFYELMQGRRAVGQVIQILSNQLDSGEILAFGETRTRPHSYRATMIDAYRTSPLLLKTAVHNLASGHRLPLAATGKAYRLPGNATVARFAARRVAELAKRLAYGALVEKEWQVAVAPAAFDEQLFHSANFPRPDQWRIVERPPQYRFLADPFFHPDGSGVLVEALRKSTGLGEIVHLSQAGAAALSEGHGHYSYPATFFDGEHHFILPEMSEWSDQKLFRLGPGRLEEVGTLDVPGAPRLLDPTLHAEAGKTYLFANCAAHGGAVLRLWVGDALAGPFLEHPASPICVSPAGGRMAGAIIALGDARYRIGQDHGRDYGDGLVLFRIDRLSPQEYRETRQCGLSFDQVRGPHTVNFLDGRMVFDFYRNRVSMLAGLRRLRARVKQRPQNNG